MQGRFLLFYQKPGVFAAQIGSASIILASMGRASGTLDLAAGMEKQ